MASNENLEGFQVGLEIKVGNARGNLDIYTVEIQPPLPDEHRDEIMQNIGLGIKDNYKRLLRSGVVSTGISSIALFNFVHQDNTPPEEVLYAAASQAISRSLSPTGLVPVTFITKPALAT